MHSEAYQATGIWFRVSKLADHSPSSPCYGAGCWTIAGFKYNDGILNNLTVLLDEASDWFVVQPGDVFSDATVGTFPPLIGLV